MKTIFVLFFIFIVTTQLSAQDRFDELKNYCNSNETILQKVTSPGSYGFIEVSYQGNSNGTFVEVISPDMYVYRYPNPNKKMLLLNDIFEERFVWLTGGGEAVTPNIYVSSIKDNVQAVVIKTYHEGSIYGNYQLTLMDSATKMLYEIKLPGSYLEKIAYFGNGFVVEQKESDYHQLWYLKTYSLVSIVNNTVVTESYQRTISAEK